MVQLIDDLLSVKRDLQLVHGLDDVPDLLSLVSLGKKITMEKYPVLRNRKPYENCNFLP
jgi:hypothetical protein